MRLKPLLLLLVAFLASACATTTATDVRPASTATMSPGDLPRARTVPQYLFKHSVIIQCGAAGGKHCGSDGKQWCGRLSTKCVEREMSANYSPFRKRTP